MADDLAERIREIIGDHPHGGEIRMFGGTCFLLRDHMLCGTGSGNFLFRVGKEAHAAAVKRRGSSNDDDLHAADERLHGGQRRARRSGFAGLRWQAPASGRYRPRRKGRQEINGRKEMT